MRILLDNGLQNGIGTGIDSYTCALAHSLSCKEGVTVEKETFAPKKGRRLSRLSYLSYLASPAYREKLKGFDVVHYTNYAMPRKVPSGVLCAVTVHDLTSFLHPRTLPFFYRFYNRFMVRRAIKHADILFTVSESAKADVLKKFPLAKDKVHAVYPGHYESATASELPPTFENPALLGLEEKKFFLFVGTLEKRTDVATLLRAYQKLIKEQESAKDFSLVLAGRMGYGGKALKKALCHLEKGADVRLPGFVSAQDRRRLYATAAAFVFPTVYEGFGSPQTECMANGTPLLLSDIPTNREVSGAYGHYFPTGDVSALCRLMEKVTSQTLPPADRALAENALQRFSWEASATAIYDIYRAKM